MYDTALEVTKAYAEYCTQQIYGDSVKLNAIRGESKSVQQLAGQIDHDTKIHFYENIVNSDGWKTGFAEVLSVLVMQADGVPVTALVGGERLLLRIEVVVHKTLLSPIVGFFVKDRLGQSLFGEHTYTYINPPCVVEGGEKIVTEFVFALPLLPNGEYSMTVSIADGKPDNHVQHHWLHDAVILHVQSTTLRYGLVGIPFEYVSMQKERIE
jgi:lipopolysaccharide transport system ATP-binding protein